MHSVMYDPKTGKATVTLTDEQAERIFQSGKSLKDILREFIGRKSAKKSMISQREVSKD